MSTSGVAILEGNTFVVSDRRGDVEGSPTDTQGLFVDDTRFLSRWVMTLDGRRPSILSTDDIEYFEVKFFLAPSSGTIYVDSELSVMRKRTVSRGFVEVITIANHAARPIDLELRIEADADFADLFEVKDALDKKGRLYRRVDTGRLVLGYGRETFVRETWIVAQGATIDEQGITFRVHLEPHGEWTTRVEPPHVRAQHHRHRSPALLSARRARLHARGGVAVVHGRVRPRQHPHQPASSPVLARARRDHVEGPRWAPRDAARLVS